MPRPEDLAEDALAVLRRHPDRWMTPSGIAHFMRVETRWLYPVLDRLHQIGDLDCLGRRYRAASAVIGRAYHHRHGVSQEDVEHGGGQAENHGDQAGVVESHDQKQRGPEVDLEPHGQAHSRVARSEAGEDDSHCQAQIHGGHESPEVIG